MTFVTEIGDMRRFDSPRQLMDISVSDRGGQRAAILYILIQTARLNDVDPQA